MKALCEVIGVAVLGIIISVGAITCLRFALHLLDGK